MLIRLHRCTGWSAYLLFAYGIDRFCHDVAHLILYKIVYLAHCSLNHRLATTDNSANLNKSLDAFIMHFICKAIRTDSLMTSFQFHKVVRKEEHWFSYIKSDYLQTENTQVPSNLPCGLHSAWENPWLATAAVRIWFQVSACWQAKMTSPQILWLR